MQDVAGGEVAEPRVVERGQFGGYEDHPAVVRDRGQRIPGPAGRRRCSFSGEHGAGEVQDPANFPHPEDGIGLPHGGKGLPEFRRPAQLVAGGVHALLLLDVDPDGAAAEPGEERVEVGRPGRVRVGDDGDHVERDAVTAQSVDAAHDHPVGRVAGPGEAVAVHVLGPVADPHADVPLQQEGAPGVVAEGQVAVGAVQRLTQRRRLHDHSPRPCGEAPHRCPRSGRARVEGTPPGPGEQNGTADGAVLLREGRRAAY